MSQNTIKQLSLIPLERSQSYSVQFSSPSSNAEIELRSPTFTHTQKCWIVTHTAIAARFELFPDCLRVGEIDLVEGNGHLAYGVAGPSSHTGNLEVA